MARPINPYRPVFKSPKTSSKILKIIFEEMLKKKISQADMAQAMGRSSGQLSAWCLGKNEPGVMTVEEMAERLGYRLTLEPIKEANDA